MTREHPTEFGNEPSAGSKLAVEMAPHAQDIFKLKAGNLLKLRGIDAFHDLRTPV